MLEKNEIVLCSVGDLMLSDSPLFVGVGVGAAFHEIKERLFNDCMKDFHTADIVIGNLESVVYNPKHKNLKELQMCCTEKEIEFLKNAGFSILNLANNHCLQHGTDSFFHTKEVCENAGINTIGIRDEKPLIYDLAGVRIAFFSVCIHIEWYQPNDIQYEDDIERVLKKVQKLHDTEPDTVIVLVAHWGDEFATFPSNVQIELAHRFVDVGTDIILGHHSHVFQGIERYKDSIIAYGQGNFVSDMVPTMCRETGIVKVKIISGSSRKNITYEVIPYFINDSLILEQNNGNWFKERQVALEEALDGTYSDKEYWNVVNAHHSSCSRDFRNRFVHTFYKYRPNVFIRMIYEFIVRKIKRNWTHKNEQEVGKN
ncbi:capsule biosynthesis protein CapA [Lachnospiraceae bacterium]|nr:capsule biosynthesis protein CapA [Lachnospiraceae bacterium]